MKVLISILKLLLMHLGLGWVVLLLLLGLRLIRVLLLVHVLVH
jgi:hypothetical protein